MQYIFNQLFWYCLCIHIALAPLQIIRWFVSPIVLAAIGTVFFCIFYINGMVLSTSLVGYPASAGTSIFMWLAVILWFISTLPHFITIFLQFPEYLGLSLIYIFAALGTTTGLLPGPLSIFPGAYIGYSLFIWQGLGYFLGFGFAYFYAFIWIIPASLALAFFNPFFQVIIILHLIYLVINLIIKFALCLTFPLVIPCLLIQICYTSYICIILRTYLYCILAIIGIVGSIISYVIVFIILVIVFLAALFIPFSIILFCLLITSPFYSLCSLHSIFFICPVAIYAIPLILIKDINLFILSGGTVCCMLVCMLAYICCFIIITTPCWCIIACVIAVSICIGICCYILASILASCCCILASCCCYLTLLCIAYLSPLIISIIIQIINTCLCCLAITCPCLIPFILCCISQLFLCLMPLSTCIYCCSNIIVLCTTPCGLCCPFIYCITIPWFIISTLLYLCLMSNLFCYLCYIPIYIFTFLCMLTICLCASLPCICIECVCIICATLIACCLMPFSCICGIILGICLSCILCCIATLFACLSTIVLCLYFPPLMCFMYCFMVGTVCFIFYGLRWLIYLIPFCIICSIICAPFTICAQIIFTLCIYYPCLCLSQCCMLCICLPLIITLCCSDLIITNPCEILKIIMIYTLFASRIKFISGLWL